MRKVSFKTSRKRMSGSSKKFSMIFAVCAVLVLVLSCIAILAKNDFNIRAAVGGDIETTTVTETETAVNLEKSDNYYLLWCTDSDGANLEFIWIARIKMPKATLSVCTVSTSDLIEYNGQAMTIGNVYSAYGEKAFREAMSETYDLDFDFYIGADTELFKQMITYFGGVTLELENPIEYRGSFNLILLKGENSLKGEQLYKYLLYTGFGADTELSDRSEVLIKIFEKAFTPAYEGKADTIFSRIVNGTSTDVTIMKYSEMNQKLNYFFENGFTKTTVCETVNDLKKK